MSRAGKILIAVFIATTTSGTAIAQPARSFGAGTYLVGSDIEPGLYRSEGEVTYFERLSGLSGAEYHRPGRNSGSASAVLAATGSLPLQRPNSS